MIAVNAEHVGAIIEQLSQQDSDVREAALGVLGKLEPAVIAEHVGAIIKQLSDPDLYVRELALGVLGMDDMFNDK